MSATPKPEQAASVASAAATEEAKLSPAELKKRAKAEKQARRAAQKEQAGAASAESSHAAINGDQTGAKQGAVAQQKATSEKQQQQHKGSQKQGEQSSKSPAGSHQASLPIRNRRGSQSQAASKEPVKKQENKNVELFSHLYTQPRRQHMEGVSKDVHPTVLEVGLQMSSYEICGSSARCVAMLLAFKEAIQEYTTPAGTSLARHLTSHYLSPQIDFLKSCRPLSESMGNAIRWLKKLIVEVDPDTSEYDAKNYLSESIDHFISERIKVTDQAIANLASEHIQDGSVVLTYASSSIVEKTIIQAHANGTRFRVVVVDSRPLYEGKNLATTLMNAGLQVEYFAFAGLARAVSDATTVLLGAHSMLSNGRLQSRIGTASVATAAHRAEIPVIVCCESVKFSGKVALDSIVINEVAPAEELLLPSKDQALSRKNDNGEETKLRNLNDWRDIQNLQILNLMYDITPAEYIATVICEYGSVSPSSVPVVHRLANEGT